MLNTLEVPTVKNASWPEIPQLRIRSAKCFYVENVWTGERLGCKPYHAVEVGRHDTAAILVGNPCDCRT